MFIRVKKKADNRFSVQLVESVRIGKKVKQNVVRHIGVAYSEEEIADLRNLAHLIQAQIEDERQPRLFSPEVVARMSEQEKPTAPVLLQEPTPPSPDITPTKNPSLPVDLAHIREIGRHITGIHDIYGKAFEELGFHTILGSPKRQAHTIHILKQLVLARLAQPSSKRDAVMRLEKDFGISLNLDTVYNTMDRLTDEVVDKMKDCTLSVTQKIFQDKIDVVFYDCTTLYFESFSEDELRRNGYSKDLKFNQPQVVLALLVTKEGLPIGYEVFPGSTYEGHTLIHALSALREKFSLDRVVFVADSGLLSEDNIAFLKAHNFYYIVGARLKNTPAATQKKILDITHYASDQENTDLRFATFEMKDQDKLIVQHSQKRALKDHYDREKAIHKLRKKWDGKNPSPKEFLSNHGYKKYLMMEGEARVVLNEEAITAAAKWDGLHGVRTNIDWMTPAEIRAQYTGLWQVEESFRIHKHDLRVRPVFHWKESRVKSHLALCYMAFACVRYLEYRVKTQYQKLSPEVMRRELVHVQTSILEHQETKQRYGLPSSMGIHAEKIYQIMRVKKNTTPFLLATEGGDSTTTPPA